MRYLITLFLLTIIGLAHADTTISYQGQLQDSSGPVDTNVAMNFALFDAETGGSQVGATVSLANVSVVDGLFQIELDFGDVYDASPLYLEIEVEGQVLLPRQRMTATPFAVRALNVPEGSGSVWEKDGDSISYWANNQGMALVVGSNADNAPRIVMGHASNQAISAGATISGGGTASDPNIASGLRAAIGGGVGNTASAIHTTIAGGDRNTASGGRSTVGGGELNFATGGRSTVPGGFLNHADGLNSFAAGQRARAMHDGTFVWSDFSESANFSSTDLNQFLIRAQGGVGIGTNAPSAALDVIGSAKFGVEWNEASGTNSFVSGGTVGFEPNPAGFANRAEAAFSFVGGGIANAASGARGFVGGGSSNNAMAVNSFIGGGSGNAASGSDSFVGGGTGNTASGARSFAAGRWAKAIHDGAFVWADNNTSDFESTGDDQFLIRAGGGVGINTNSPENALDVAGSIRATGQLQVGSTLFLGSLGGNTGSEEVCRNSSTGRLAPCSSSSLRYKEQIEDLDHAWDQVSAMRAVNYQFIADGQEDLGLIAEELAEIDSRLVVFDGEGRPDSIRYGRLSVVLVAAFQERDASMQARLAEIERENAELRQLADRNNELEARLATLEAVLLEDRQVVERSQ